MALQPETDILAAAIAKIEAAGVQHAPEQHYLDGGGVYGREVLTTTEPGIYYLTSEDNLRAGEKKPLQIQLLWVNVPEFGLGRVSAHKVAEMLGWRVKEAPKPLEIIPPTAPVTVLAAIIEPVN